MSADDIVISSDSCEEVEETLENWRNRLAKRGMKVSRPKTQYMCVNEKDQNDWKVRMQGIVLAKLKEFKYLGSTVQKEGRCEREISSAREFRHVGVDGEKSAELFMIRKCNRD